MSEVSVVVRFVLTGCSAAHESMQSAFKAVSNLGCSVWFSPEDCLKVINKDKQFIYVFDEFSGEAFKHLVSVGCRIYGPTCILHCLKDSDVLPRLPHPVYCKAMDGVVISCTNISGESRDVLHQRVQWMMGGASKDFHERVTHLIAGQVGSKKYVVAARLGKAIMTPEWIEAVWNNCRLSYKHSSDAAFAVHRCPIFKGFVISVSGMDGEERLRVRNLVEQNGGQYSGEMKVNECTHLILHTPKGQKYDYAVKWNINIVNVAWLQESVTAGYSLDEAQFPVTSDGNRAGIRIASATTSTPTNTVDGHVSTLSNVSSIMTTHIDDTVMSTTRNNLSMAAIDPLDAVDLSTTRPVSFLDGCKIYVDGMSGARLEKVRKIINRGGGTRYNQINESVSHVVVGEIENDTRKLLHNLTSRPHVVSVQWLVDCLKEGRRVSESKYTCFDLPAELSPSRLISRIGNKDVVSVNNTIFSAKKASSTNNVNPIDHDEFSSLISQYQPAGTLGESTLMRAAEIGELDADVTMDVQPAAESHGTRAAEIGELDADVTMDVQPAAEAQHGDQSMLVDECVSHNDTTMQDDDGEKPLFKDRTFVISGFEADEEAVKFLSEMIKEHGGIVLNKSRRTHQIIDYAVVPVFGCEVKITVSEIVTNAWLQVCVEEGRLVPSDSHEMYQPISVIADNQPLDGCVLSISGYSGIERDVLLQLSEHLGGVCQEYFVKRANKGLMASTHLIVNTASGSKYSAAKKWKLPTVTKHWLLECARTGRRVPEERYDIDNQMDEGVDDTCDVSHRMNDDNKQSATKPPKSSSPNAEVRRAVSDSTPLKNEMLNAELDRRGVSDDMTSKNEISVGVRCQAVVPDVGVEKPVVTCGEDADHRTGVKRNVASEASTKNASPLQQREAQIEHADDKHRKKLDAVNENELRLLKLVSPLKEDVPRSVQKANKPAKTVLKNQTVENLIQSEAVHVLQKKTNDNDGVDTPGKFLDPRKEFHPKLDLADVMAALDSPLLTPRALQRRNTSLPLEDVFSTNLAIAVKNSNAPHFAGEHDAFSQSQDISVENCLKKDTCGPLKGVVIAVCKKLSKNQSEYNNIAVSLGADYRWMYDNSCTHFIFQGRMNDVNKEFRVARDHCKYVVSPHWLNACSEQQCRVDETIYPHTYNPTMSLSITGHKTPARPTRSSLRTVVKSPPAATSSALSAAMRNSLVASAAAAGSGSGQSPATVTSTSTIHESSEHLSNTELREFMATADDDAVFENINTTQSDEDIAKACGKVEEEQDKTSNTERLIDDLNRVMKACKTVKTRAVSRHHGSSDSPADLNGELKRIQSTESLIGRDIVVPGNASRHSKVNQKLAGRQKSKVGAEHQTQPSQIVEVVWDDPIAREQRELMASELAKDSESPTRPSGCSPVKANVERRTDAKSIVAIMTSDNSFSKQVVSSVTVNFRSSDAGLRTVPSPAATVLWKTPLPAADNSPGINNLRPTSGSAEQIKSRTDRVHTKSDKKRVFIFSGLPQPEKDKYASYVQKLGGETLDAANYTPLCTHLIVGSPTRNEKYLSCVAAGKWVLHKSYLEEAWSLGCFPSEEQFEWGGPGMKAIVAALPEQFMKLAQASHRWRLQLSAVNKGAFDGWRTLLLTESKREDGFKRLLEAGGATVLADKSMTTFSDITHAFLDLSKFKVQVNLEAMVRASVHCVKPEFIAIYLTDDPPPNAALHCIPEAVPFVKAEETRKRKVGQRPSEDSSVSKRLRPS